MSLHIHATSTISTPNAPATSHTHDESDSDSDLKSRAPQIHSATNTKNASANAYTPNISSLLQNGLLWARIIVSFIATFLCILAICYAIGQALSITVTNYFCDEQELSDIRHHSRTYNLPHGSPNTCWEANDFTVNKTALWTGESYGYKMDTSSRAITKCIAFIVLAIAFIICLLHSIVTLVRDIINYYRKELGKTHYNHQLNPPQPTYNTNFLSTFCTWYKNRLFVDSGIWCLWTVLREIVEIYLQSCALLLYNGTHLYRDNFDPVALALPPQYIRLFVAFLSANCISTGILWGCYAFRPVLCHGLVFELILYCFDAIFDLFYATYPLMIVFNVSTSDSIVLAALASLQTDSPIAFLATFVPMIFLLVKCWYLLQRATRGMERYYGKKYLNCTNTGNTPSVLPRMDLTGMPSISSQSQATDINGANRTLSPIVSLPPQSRLRVMSTVSWVLSDQPNVSNTTNPPAGTNDKDTDISITVTLMKEIASFKVNSKQCMLLILSIIFVSYGITALVLVQSHFNYAIEYCDSLTKVKHEYVEFIATDHLNVTYEFDTTTRQLLNDNSELFWWDKCSYKVYPFDLSGRSNVCQCRIFYLSFDHKHNVIQHEYIDWNANQLNQYFGIDAVSTLMNVVRRFYMLEKLGIYGVDSVYNTNKDDKPQPRFNFTKDMFRATKLKVFAWDRLRIGYIDNAMSNWQELVYFELRRSEATLPSSFDQLTNVELFNFGQDIHFFSDFPEQICACHKLKSIRMDVNKLVAIPHCIAKLHALETIIFSYTFIRNIPIELFSMRSLKELIFENVNITIGSLMKYNNITSFTEFDERFMWDSHKKYQFQSSAFCVEFNDNQNDLDSLYPAAFIEFIKETGSCETPCSTKIASIACPSFEFQDGICHNECNNRACQYDGGDCIQTCDFDECDYRVLGNGICDIGCNNSDCNHDHYDCIEVDSSICNKTYGTEHLCETEWLGDGFCDSECSNSKTNLCQNDGNDCGGHSCDPGTQCEQAYFFFTYLSNYLSNDRMVEEKELCSLWVHTQSFAPAVAVYYVNCTNAMKRMDLNENSYISFHEFIAGLSQPFFNITKQKALQINCSQCVGVDDYYS
eukprot:60146_1